MITRFPRLAGLLCLAFILSISASCGRKTEPLVPESPRPEAVQDVKAVARDAVAFLSWRIPDRNIEGKEMNPADIKAFRIFRAEIGREKRKPRYKEIVTIDMAKPAPAEVQDGTVYWSDTGLKYGMIYGYRIRAVSTRGGVSPFSEEARVAPQLSLAPPKNLAAAGGENLVTLTWDPVRTRADGSAYEGFVGYNVYRRTDKGRYEETPLNKEPLRTNSYRDTTVENNRTYYYMVRAVDSPTRPWRESLDSTEASATPKKTTPPARPTGLTVVPGVGRVFLTWNENKERDLAGYYVYRSTRSGRGYVRLMDKPINRTTYSDETVKPGRVYYYVVTAVDQYGNESAWSKEQKTYAETPR